MPNNESVGKKIVEALKKQAESIDMETSSEFEEISAPDDIFASSNDDILSSENSTTASKNFFDDVEEDSDPFFTEIQSSDGFNGVAAASSDAFEMPANIAVLKKLISQLPSGVSRHTGAQIIKQTMEALGISMKSVLQDAQQVQDSLKISARECQSSIQEYKKQILNLEKQSQNYQKQYSALNDLISLFIQTTK